MGEQVRCFVAVFPPAEVLDALAALRRRLEPGLPGLGWTKRENLHFTLRFFGERAADDVAAASQVLDRTAASVRSFELVLAELGVFPSWSRPRVLWVGSGAGGETLAAVAHDLERGFEDAGLGRADKPFVPHLTLGRWRVSAPVDPGPLAASRREGEPGAFRVDSVALMKSVLHPRGSIYTPLHVARFAS